MSENNNSYLDDLNLDTYVEPQVFAAGSQVTFKIIDVESKEGIGQESGKPWCNLQLVLQPQEWNGALSDTGEEVTNPKVVYFPIWLAPKGADDKQRNRAKGNVLRAYDAIGESPAGGKAEATDFYGKELTATVKINTSGELPRNDVMKLIIE